MFLIFFTRIILMVLGVQFSRGARLRCYKGTIDNYIITPIDTPLLIADSPCIDKTLPTVFYTFGYRGRVAGPATTAMVTAYLNTKKRNVVLVDWEDEARSGVLGIPLAYVLYAVPNAKKVGDQLGEALVQLGRAGMNMTRVHLLGHSLGAHLMAYAGRTARESGYVVSRITGLDPARALFEGSFAVQRGLDRTCARFVDIIHSDPGGYGTSRPSGSVDFWPNYSGPGVAQPGCPSDGSYEMFSPEVYTDYYPDSEYGVEQAQNKRLSRHHLCSHDRSWRYFAESLASPTSFMAVEAADYDHWRARDYNTNNTIYMGDLTSTRARGNYFLNTEPQSPYGEDREGITPTPQQTRRRRTPSSLSISRFLRYLR